ncbi:hypothetical protein [Kibdelosporangium aridum]|uniref:hypothetical protein n=1 Tax=Kibdelosporangium aridum TaxID=2030 RepID=UPI0035EDD080
MSNEPVAPPPEDRPPVPPDDEYQPDGGYQPDGPSHHETREAVSDMVIRPKRK